MIPTGVRIFVCTEPVGMRYGFDRLAPVACERDSPGLPSTRCRHAGWRSASRGARSTTTGSRQNDRASPFRGRASSHEGRRDGAVVPASLLQSCGFRNQEESKWADTTGGSRLDSRCSAGL